MLQEIVLSTISHISVVSGSLPAGVTIGSTSNPSGSTYRAVISGTMPTITSETLYTFTVRATDAQGQTTDQALSLYINCWYTKLWRILLMASAYL